MQWKEDHHHYNFDVRKGPIHVEWFKGATTNICYNALDRHVRACRADALRVLEGALPQLACPQGGDPKIGSGDPKIGGGNQG